MRRIALLALALACAGSRTAPNLPVKGDHRYDGYVAVEGRVRALAARDPPPD